MSIFRRPFWAPLLFCAACASPGAEDGRTRASTAPIVGGQLDTTTKGVVALALSAHNQVAVFCSGSLLAPNLVLTARHCIAQIGDGSTEQVSCSADSPTRFTGKYDPRELFVSTDTQPEPGGRLYGVSEIREAPGSDQVCGYDLALLILTSNVPPSAGTPLEPVLDAPAAVDAAFSAVGYGLQSPKDTQGTTAGSRMRFDGSSVYCVGTQCPSAAEASRDEFVGNSPVCSGDSGGPALDRKGRVFGVTSRGDPDCTYALYSNVASWADFVRSAAADAAQAGKYVAASWVSSAGGADPSTNAGAPSGGSGGASGAAGMQSGGSAQGGTSAGPATPPAGPSTPTVDPTGAACTGKGDCPGTYQCYSATRTPPGMCVPRCTNAAANCPARYTCDESLGVCTPEPAHVAKISASSSCAASTQPSTGSGALASLVALGFACRSRRHRRKHP